MIISRQGIRFYADCDIRVTCGDVRRSRCNQADTVFFINAHYQCTVLQCLYGSRCLGAVHHYRIDTAAGLLCFHFRFGHNILKKTSQGILRFQGSIAHIQFGIAIGNGSIISTDICVISRLILISVSCIAVAGLVFISVSCITVAGLVFISVSCIAVAGLVCISAAGITGSFDITPVCLTGFRDHRTVLRRSRICRQIYT